MLKLKFEALLTALALALTYGMVIPATARADDGHDHAGHNHDGHDHPEVVAFRLPKWKEIHFDDAGKAEQHFKTVKQLGCEAKMDSHGGHTDVVYRCIEWKQITLKNHNEGHQWERWLAASGFDTWHGHVDESLAHGDEAVEFRLTEWKRLHFDTARAGDKDQVTATLKKLGCQIKEDQHGGHIDVAFRCPVWSTIRVPDHRTADRWMGWLEKTGFETKHSHAADQPQAAGGRKDRR